jgi:hypothetical protein
MINVEFISNNTRRLIDVEATESDIGHGFEILEQIQAERLGF